MLTTEVSNAMARVQFGMFSILIMLHHITAAVVSFPKNNNVGRHISHTSYSNGKGHNHKQIHHADDAYFYEYLVHGTNNENHHGETQYFGQAEYRDENNLAISGKYYVQLPDGRVQVVRYRVDKDSGYVADVSYINPSAKTLPAIVPYNNSPRFDPVSEHYSNLSPLL